MSALALADAGTWLLCAGAVMLAAYAAWQDLSLSPPPAAILSIGAVAALTLLLSSVSDMHTPAAAAFAALCVVCALIAEIDRRRRLIPDALVLAIFLLALVIPSPDAWLSKLIGAVLLGALFFAVRAMFERSGRGEALGLGDVKLAAAIGAVLGAFDGLIAITIAGAATIAAVALFSLAPRTASEPVSTVTIVPFGIGLSAALAFMCALRIWGWA